MTVAINADAPVPVRRVRDLELFLDRLAVVELAPDAGPVLAGDPIMVPAIAKMF